MSSTLRRVTDSPGQRHTIDRVSSDSGSAARSRGRVRGFVSSRSASQRIGAGAVVAILLTAPFGGLSPAKDQYEAKLQLGHRYDLGPFYLTLDKVETLSDLSPAVTPQDPGDRLLVIEITVTNHTDESFIVSSAVDTIGGDHTGAIPWPGDVRSAEEFGGDPPTTAEPKVFNVADASDMLTEAFNPGQTYQLAIVVEQRPGWDPKDLVLYLLGLVHQDEDPTTLESGGHWVQKTYVARGHVDVETKP
jgi:hypothetical protein